MKTLVLKEFRENAKVAVLGLIIYTLLLVVPYRDYIASPTNMSQPLVNGEFLMSTAWFCAIFGAVLGWLQIHNERRPDLWAFLIHRPMSRTSIFVGKALAGLGLYALVAGLPLLGFVVWAWLPGRVGAPFEPAMLRPVAMFFLAGTVYYFAGMLTGLRQARWYASRALGLGVAIIVLPAMQLRPEFWLGLVSLVIGAAMLITAVWGGFQSDGHYRGQPAWGKAALTGALTLGSLIVLFVAVMLLSNIIPNHEPSGPWSNYTMTKTGAVFKVTTDVGRPPEMVDLEGKPLLDAKTGRMIELSVFNRRLATATQINVDQDDRNRDRSWIQADCSLFSSWRATTDTLWYFWDRYGRLAGYDVATRQFIGSLGPKGFARDIAGDGDRFTNGRGDSHARTLRTATTVFLVDVEQRTTKPLFTTPDDDPILAMHEIVLNGYDWEYSVVITKRFIHLLTAEGKPVWKIPYEPAYPDYTNIQMYSLEPPGQFALWLAPSDRAKKHATAKLPTHVIWLAGDQGVVKSIDLPELPSPSRKLGRDDLLFGCVTPPTALLGYCLIQAGVWQTETWRTLLLFSFGGSVLVCLPVGWWLGRRYHFSFAAQAGWAVFHLLFGVPGLLAFLSVQEWPAREACPNCKKLRVVDRAQCEHCGADFAPPEKTGTEVFAPLGAE
jgi:ABC-type transport system involved in multi-copper enzyme maturation permease subunit